MTSFIDNQLQVSVIFCVGQGFWSDIGEFHPDLNGATLYTSKERALADIRDLCQSVLEDGRLFLFYLNASFDLAGGKQLHKKTVDRILRTADNYSEVGLVFTEIAFDSASILKANSEDTHGKTG